MTANGAILGVMAHIRGGKPGSARYDDSMTDAQRNHFDNLIFLCPNHHAEIDKLRPELYPPARLLEMKAAHERWAAEQCRKRIPEIHFGELQVVTAYLTEAQVLSVGGFEIIPLQDKIHRNSLSAAIETNIRLGLSRVSLVENYIQSNLDPEFGTRLRQGFVNRYVDLKTNSGLAGDDLFHALWQFSSGNSSDFSIQAAGLTVLVYLFQSCDVFEK
ncbi:MAG: hypothetical protein BWY71_01144 [Planctomycetes bacterium ADurb.Bin412]|nr:MAG: hypothetical protein BWY71_01144 [Planctomycetes bacterium ADurb.Bin412]